MLILVVVTINIATSGELVNKTIDAKTQTQAATQNELNQMNTTAVEIAIETRIPDTFDFTETYDNIYVHPHPKIEKRVVFTLNGTATGDSQARDWKFDADPRDNTFLINRIISSTIDPETGSGEYEVEQYLYAPDEIELPIGEENVNIPAGWTHQNITLIVTSWAISDITEDSTIVQLNNSQIPVFSNCTFDTDAEIDTDDEQPTFDSIKDVINNFISYTSSYYPN